MTGNNDGEYKCEMCGGWYRKAWSDAEAIEHSIENASAFDEASDALRAAGVWKPDDEDMIVVCDDCYQLLTPPGGWPADKDDDDLLWRCANAEIESGTAGGIVFFQPAGVERSRRNHPSGQQPDS